MAFYGWVRGGGKQSGRVGKQRGKGKGGLGIRGFRREDNTGGGT